MRDEPGDVKTKPPRCGGLIPRKVILESFEFGARPGEHFFRGPQFDQSAVDLLASLADFFLPFRRKVPFGFNLEAFQKQLGDQSSILRR